MAMNWLGSSLQEKYASWPKGREKYSRTQLNVYIYSSHETFTASDERKGRGRERTSEETVCTGSYIISSAMVIFRERGEKSGLQ